MTPDQIFADLEQELQLEIRTWLLMADQAASEGDRCWTCEIHKARADALHAFGLWMAAHFHLTLTVDDGA